MRRHGSPEIRRFLSVARRGRKALFIGGRAPFVFIVVCASCNIRIPSSNSSPAPDPDCDTSLVRPVPGPLFTRAGGRIDCSFRLITQRMMRTKTVLALAVVSLAIPLAASNVIMRRSSAGEAAAAAIHAPQTAREPSQARVRADVAAMQAFRPGYPFWRHVFTIPDGSIAFGSAVDGRLLATFPAKGDWSRRAVWTDPTLARAPRRPVACAQTGRATRAGGASHGTRRRTGAAQLDARRCAPHERAEIRSLPRGVGRHLRAVRRARGHRPGPGHLRIGPERHAALERQRRRLLPVAAEELEATELLLADPDPGTEPDDAGALLRRVLVGPRHEIRIVHPRALRAQRRRHERGTRADHRRAPGWADVRARYLLGSQLARDLRTLPGKDYEEVYGSYGFRSHLYAEMVFGNAFNVSRLIASMPQMSIHAMRTPRAISLTEIVKRTVSPRTRCAASIRRSSIECPPGRALYLPSYVSEFGRRRRVLAPAGRARPTGRSR